MDAPLPPLVWDDDSQCWSGSVRLPWYATDEPPALDIHPWWESDPPAPPTPEQVAAVRQVVAASDTLRRAILSGFRLHIPQLRAADWPALERFFVPTVVRVLPHRRDGLAYVGLDFSCLQFTHGYEHGVGLTVHGDRVLRFGVAGGGGSEDDDCAAADGGRAGPPGE